MSNVLEQFHAAQAAVKNAQEALESLRALLGQAPTPGNGVIIGLTRKQPTWMDDPAKKARAIARFKRTMKARRLARAAGQSTAVTADV